MNDVQPPEETSTQNPERHALQEEHRQGGGRCKSEQLPRRSVARRPDHQRDRKQRPRLVTQPRQAEREAAQDGEEGRARLPGPARARPSPAGTGKSSSTSRPERSARVASSRRCRAEMSPGRPRASVPAAGENRLRPSRYVSHMVRLEQKSGKRPDVTLLTPIRGRSRRSAGPSRIARNRYCPARIVQAPIRSPAGTRNRNTRCRRSGRYPETTRCGVPTPASSSRSGTPRSIAEILDQS